jgi:hypothetical protein
VHGRTDEGILWLHGAAMEGAKARRQDSKFFVSTDTAT